MNVILDALMRFGARYERPIAIAGIAWSALPCAQSKPELLNSRNTRSDRAALASLCRPVERCVVGAGAPFAGAAAQGDCGRGEAG